jgi:hypothetical protein
MGGEKDGRTSCQRRRGEEDGRRRRRSPVAAAGREHDRQGEAGREGRGVLAGGGYEQRESGRKRVRRGEEKKEKLVKPPMCGTHVVRGGIGG